MPIPTTRAASRSIAIRGLLAQGAGGQINASVVADAVLHTWDRFNAQLAPVIGARGTEAIFGRALRLTSAAFPWLSGGRQSIDAASPLVNLSIIFASQDAAAAAEAGVALLFTFTNLLATLIGDAVTDRLLNPVLATSLTAIESETPS